MRFVAILLLLLSAGGLTWGAEDGIVIDDAAQVVGAKQLAQSPDESGVEETTSLESPASEEPAVEESTPVEARQEEALSEGDAGSIDAGIEQASRPVVSPAGTPVRAPMPAKPSPAAQEADGEPQELIEVIDEEETGAESGWAGMPDYEVMLKDRAFADFMKAGIVFEGSIEGVEDVETFVSSVLFPRVRATTRDEVVIDGSYGQGRRFAVYGGDRGKCGFEYRSMAVIAGTASASESRAIISRGVYPVSQGDAIIPLESIWKRYQTQKADAREAPAALPDGFVEGVVVCLGEGRVMATRPDDVIFINKGRIDGVVLGLAADAFSKDADGESGWGSVVRVAEQSCMVKVRKLYRPIFVGDPVEILGVAGAASAGPTSE